MHRIANNGNLLLQQCSLHPFMKVLLSNFSIRSIQSQRKCSSCLAMLGVTICSFSLSTALVEFAFPRSFNFRGIHFNSLAEYDDSLKIASL